MSDLSNVTYRTGAHTFGKHGSGMVCCCDSNLPVLELIRVEYLSTLVDWEGKARLDGHIMDVFLSPTGNLPEEKKNVVSTYLEIVPWGINIGPMSGKDGLGYRYSHGKDGYLFYRWKPSLTLENRTGEESTARHRSRSSLEFLFFFLWFILFYGGVIFTFSFLYHFFFGGFLLLVSCVFESRWG